MADEASLEIRITAQITQAQEALDSIGRSMEELAAKFEGSGGVSDEAIKGIQDHVEELQETMEETRDKVVSMHLDDEQFKEGVATDKAELDSVPDKKTVIVDEKTEDEGGTGGGAEKAGSEGLSLMASSIMAVLPAITPLLAVAAAGAMGLASALAAAGAGAIGLAAVAVPSIEAVISGTGKLDAQEKAAVNSLKQFESFYKSFAAQFQAPVLNAFIIALKMLESLMTDFKPVITGAASALTVLMKSASSALGSPFWKEFFSYLGGTAKTSLVELGQSIGNLVKGFAALLMAFDPLSKSMMSGLAGITGSFAKWATALSGTQGFKNFLDYVRQEGPKVISLIGNLGKAVGQILKDWGPVGAVILNIVNSIVKAIDAVSKFSPTLVKMAGVALSAFGTMKLLEKGFGFLFKADTLIDGIKGIATAMGLMGDAEKTVSFGEALMDSLNPMGWIVLGAAVVTAAVALIIDHWKQVRSGLETYIVQPSKSALQGVQQGWKSFTNLLKSIWSAIQDDAERIWNSITNFFRKWGTDLLIVFAPVFGIPVLIAQHWGQIAATASKIWSDVVREIKDIWNGFISWITGAAKAVGDAVVDAFSWMYNHNYYFKDLVDFITNTFTTLKQDITAIWNDIKNVFSTVWNAIKATADSFWNREVQGWKTIWNTAVNTAKTIFNPIVNFFKDIWNSIHSGVSNSWNSIVSSIRSLISSAVNVMESPFRAIASWFRFIWNSVRSAASSGWSSITGSIRSAVSSAIKAVESPFRSIGSFFSSLWGSARSWGSNLINMIGQGIESAIGNVTKAVSGVASKIKSLLGFHSPTEEGPGSDADTWAPNFMRMYASGFLSNLSQVQSAAKKVAQTLQTGLSLPSLNASISGSSALAITHSWPGGASPGTGGTVISLGDINVSGNITQNEQQLANTVASTIYKQLKMRAKLP